MSNALEFTVPDPGPSPGEAYYGISRQEAANARDYAPGPYNVDDTQPMTPEQAKQAAAKPGLRGWLHPSHSELVWLAVLVGAAVYFNAKSR